MCELFAMSGRIPADVTFSLESFAAHGGMTGPHRDGWGIAYYEQADVRLLREPEPAADSAWVRFIEAHPLRSCLVISHLRRATQGVRSLENTQPFIRELAGRMHVFAHNGDLHGVEHHPALSLGSYRPVGTTDSEYACCALLERMRPLWLNGGAPPSLEARLDVVCRFARALRPLGPANFLYADGEVLFAHGHRRTDADGQIRPPGLFSLCRSCTHEPSSVDTEGLTIATTQGQQEVVLVASVPLTDEPWTPLGEGEVLALGRGAILGGGVGSHGTGANQSITTSVLDAEKSRPSR